MSNLKSFYALIVITVVAFVTPALGKPTLDISSPSNKSVGGEMHLDPLKIPTRLVNISEHRTVQDAIEYYIEPIDYRFVKVHPAPSEAIFIASKPIPPQAKKLGMVTIERALLLLIGENNKVLVDHKNKLISVEPMNKPEQVPVNTVIPMLSSSQKNNKYSLPSYNITNIKPVLYSKREKKDKKLDTVNNDSEGNFEAESIIVSFPDENGVNPTNSDFISRVIDYSENEVTRFEIRGHSHGWSKVGNKELAIARADTVKDLLVSAGVKKSMIRRNAFWSKTHSPFVARGVEITVILKEDNDE